MFLEQNIYKKVITIYGTTHNTDIHGVKRHVFYFILFRVMMSVELHYITLNVETVYSSG